MKRRVYLFVFLSGFNVAAWAVAQPFQWSQEYAPTAALGGSVQGT